ncbi:MerR family transcriptional regulator [Streptomyces stelliscabiei]|uniref:MerR family transcriptional regulator n=1 Tax=Streptomyces stelliscabiei TaxID=146820 RepID=UPI002FF04C16
MDATPPHYTTAEAAQQATQWRRLVSAGAAAVTPATIRSWAARGHLQATGLDEHNRPLYALPDLAKAERATRSRALRLVGIAKASQNGHLAITGHTPGA